MQTQQKKKLLYKDILRLQQFLLSETSFQIVDNTKIAVTTSYSDPFLNVLPNRCILKKKHTVHEYKAPRRMLNSGFRLVENIAQQI